MKSKILIVTFVVVAVLLGAGTYFVHSLKPVALIAKTKRHVAVRSVPGTVEVIVYDVAGREVVNLGRLDVAGENRAELVVPVDGLRPGIYFPTAFLTGSSPVSARLTVLP